MTKSSLKNFILDTNILLEDPNAIKNFENNNVIIPIIVLEELDKFKKGSDQKARHARSVSRSIDNLKNSQDIAKGIKINNKNGKLFVQILNKKIHKIFESLTVDPFENTNDNFIISTALFLKEDNENTILVTRDSNMRIKARALGLEAQDYEAQKINFDEIYSGVSSIIVNDEKIINEIYKPTGNIDVLKEIEKEQKIKLLPNQFLIINEGIQFSAITKIENKNIKLLSKRGNDKKEVFGITAKNLRQKFALDLLLNDDIKLVSLIGPAGSGKTLLSIAVGLSLVIEKGRYKSLTVARPVVPMGGPKNDIGFLPGNKDEKLSEWMQPIYDNLDFIFDSYNIHDLLGSKDKEVNFNKLKPYDYLKDTGLLKVEALTFIRGRSIPNQFIIVDECQNCSKNELKTIISRAGDGTKVVLTGDPDQIDTPYLDSMSCGLSYVVEALKEEEITGSIILNKGERSQLANIASKLL